MNQSQLMSQKVKQSHFTSKALVLVIAILTTPLAFAQDSANESEKVDVNAKQGEKVNIKNIRKKYWAKGKKAKIGVVQNRKFSKANKYQLGVFGGINAVDPFLSVQTLGLSFGYHFTERYSLSLTGWYNFVGNSTAFDVFQTEKDGNINTNEPAGYIGLENNWSLLYGKLSFLGHKIIYFDLHIGAGLGLDFTETGHYLAPSILIGQRFFITKVTSLRFDYRFKYRRETFFEKTINTNSVSIGQEYGPRNAFSHVITIGVDFLLGSGDK